MNIKKRRSIHSHNTKCSSPISVNENRNVTITNNVDSDEDINTEDERLDAMDSSNEENEINDSLQRTSVTPEYRQKKLNVSYTNKQYENVQHHLNVTPQTSSSGHGITLIIVVLLFGVVASMYYFSPNQSTEPVAYKVCPFDNFRKKYPNQQESVWRRLTVGIENILNKRVKEPAVYLFLHQGKQNIDKLIKEIATHYSSCFGNDMRPVEIESKDFTSENAVEDYGYAIEKYKLKIKEGKVILIANLNEIPAEAARALHTICDTISPIVNDVIIILTLVAQNIEGHAVQIARDALEELWAPKLGLHELEPLITRVTADVIVLQS